MMSPVSIGRVHGSFVSRTLPDFAFVYRLLKTVIASRTLSVSSMICSSELSNLRGSRNPQICRQLFRSEGGLGTSALVPGI